MKKVERFLSEWWGVICTVLFIVLVVVSIIWGANQPRLPEGYVTNKMHFPGRSSCTEKGCDYTSDRWIVSVQNGDEFDSWYVSESYYDSVHIGDWVKK